jgi:1-deoxyxylulose-5-phosphate synthase
MAEICKNQIAELGQVSEIGLGTYHIFKHGAVMAHDIVTKAIDLGINFIDTSDNYNGSEDVLGRIVSSSIKREDIVIATKTGFARTQEEANMFGSRRVDASSRRIKKAVEDSLLRMGIDHIDLYQMHAYDDLTPVEEVVFTLKELQDAGKIRYAGVSNYSYDQLLHFIDAAKSIGLLCLTLQNGVNILSCKKKKPSDGLHQQYAAVELMRSSGGFVLAHSPLLKGLLTDRIAAQIKSDAYNNEDDKESAEILEKLSLFCKSNGVSMQHIAIAGLTLMPNTVPLVGPTNIDQLNDISNYSSAKDAARHLNLV